MEEKKNCKLRIGTHLKGRIDDLDKLWTLYKNDPETSDEELGNFNEYGLCFDYVTPHTFNGQRKGYFRYQLSCGGPADEFRFYTGPEFEVYRIEYWFLDWFDGARRVLTGKKFYLLKEIFDDLKECGTIEHIFKKAQEE